MRLLAVVLLGGCAHTLHYEPVFWPLHEVGPADAPDLAAAVEQHLAAGRLSSVGVATEPGAVRSVQADGLTELPPEALYALHLCARRWCRGAELDLIVPGPGDPRPVQIQVSLQREAVLAWTEPVRERAPPRAEPAMRTLTQRYGLAGFEVEGGASWADGEVAVVRSALGLLDVRERSAVRGLVFVRAPTRKGVPASELAYYDPRYEPVRIEVYDRAFAWHEFGFVGPVDDRQRTSALVVLHEVGHSVADIPLRRAYRHYLELEAQVEGSSDPDDARRRAKEAHAAYRSLGKRGPVLAAYRKIRTGRRGPTTRRQRGALESFAESFALFHADPDALQRAMPEVYAWFAAGGHLTAAGIDASD